MFRLKVGNCPNFPSAYSLISGCFLQYFYLNDCELESSWFDDPNPIIVFLQYSDMLYNLQDCLDGLARKFQLKEGQAAMLDFDCYFKNQSTGLILVDWTSGPISSFLHLATGGYFEFYMNLATLGLVLPILGQFFRNRRIE